MSLQQFSQEWLIRFFLIFGTMVGKSNIVKLIEPFFPEKFIFGPSLGKRAPNRPNIECLGFFEKFWDVSFRWKESIIKTNIVVDISPTYLA